MTNSTVLFGASEISPSPPPSQRNATRFGGACASIASWKLPWTGSTTCVTGPDVVISCSRYSPSLMNQPGSRTTANTFSALASISTLCTISSGTGTSAGRDCAAAMAVLLESGRRRRRLLAACQRSAARARLLLRPTGEGGRRARGRPPRQEGGRPARSVLRDRGGEQVQRLLEIL